MHLKSDCTICRKYVLGLKKNIKVFNTSPTTNSQHTHIHRDMNTCTCRHAHTHKHTCAPMIIRLRRKRRHKISNNISTYKSPYSLNLPRVSWHYKLFVFSSAHHCSPVQKHQHKAMIVDGIDDTRWISTLCQFAYYSEETEKFVTKYFKTKLKY